MNLYSWFYFSIGFSLPRSLCAHFQFCAHFGKANASVIKLEYCCNQKSIRPDCWRFFTCQNENQDRMNGFTIIIWSTLFQCGAHFISRAPKFSNNNHWHLQCYDSTQYQTAIPFLFSIQETHMQMLSTRGSFVRSHTFHSNQLCNAAHITYESTNMKEMHTNEP